MSSAVQDLKGLSAKSGKEMKHVNWARDISPILRKYGIGYKNKEVIVYEGEPEHEELTELYEVLGLSKIKTAYNQGTQDYDEKQAAKAKENQKQQQVVSQNAIVINNLIQKLIQVQQNIQTT